VIRDVDVAVIGGGPAGLAAALGARRAEARVLLLERDDCLGGILNQCIHDGFGLVLYNESISGPEYAERLAEDAVREGIVVETGAMVLDLAAGRTMRVNSRGGYGLVRAKAVVLAMGCRERTRDMIEIPGDRPAGVWTAGTAQNLVNLRNLRIGNEIVILGSGDIGLIMARRLTFEGLRVKGVFEILPWAGGLERNIRQCLFDFSIPLELSTTVIDIRGRERVSSVVVARVDDRLKPLAGTEREIACDTLLLSVGLIPENELSRRAGVVLSPATGGAVVDETFMTTVPGIFFLRQRPPDPRRGRRGFPRGVRSGEECRPVRPGGRRGPGGSGRDRGRSGDQVCPAADRPARNGRSRPSFPGRGAAPERLDRGLRPVERNDAVPEKISPPPSLGASADHGENGDRGGP
jgi:Thioredoxin reductase